MLRVARERGTLAASAGVCSAMRVILNADMCEGHGKCEKAAPEVFKLGNDDVSVVLLEDVPAALEEKVERAIRLCPRQAISWTKS
jgi:ferredoxin